MNPKVSGQKLIAIVLAICLSLVGFALVQRSSQTQKIRRFFEAQGARLIQRGPQVWIAYGTDASGQPIELEWQDISHAPGLIHLRATLVDDRYFQWSTLSEVMTNPSDNDYIKLRFCETDQCMELWMNPKTGFVYSLPSKRAVQLIDSSRQAIDQYLKETRP